jgi:hypothetical protein
MAILNLCQVFVLNMFLEKWRRVPDGVLGGYFRGMGMVWSTCRVLPRNWRWSCVIDLIL